MQVTAVHNKEIENKGHVGTDLERTRNVLGMYSERVVKGVVKRRGREDRRKGERGKQRGKQY